MTRIYSLPQETRYQDGFRRFRIDDGKLRAGDENIPHTCSAVELLNQIERQERSISPLSAKHDLFGFGQIKELLEALEVKAYRFLGKGKDSLVLEVPSEKITTGRLALKIGERRYSCIPWQRPYDCQIDAPIYGIKLACSAKQSIDEYLLTLQGIPDRFLTSEEEPIPTNLNKGKPKYQGTDAVKTLVEYGIFDQSGTKLLLDSGNYGLSTFYDDVYKLSPQRQGLQSLRDYNAVHPQGEVSRDGKWRICDVPIIKAEEIEWY